MWGRAGLLKARGWDSVVSPGDMTIWTWCISLKNLRKGKNREELK